MSQAKNISLNIHRDLFNERFFPLLTDYGHRWEIYRGSAGSGKSHFITQKLLVKALKEKRTIMVCRKYGSTIRNSVWQLWKDVLFQFKIADICKIQDSYFRIELPNGSTIFCVGLDSEEKLLSLAGVTDIWVEETTEVEREIIDQLNLRLRSAAPDLQIILSFNPISNKHWLFDFCEENKPRNCLYNLSTYKHNKFLPASYVEAIEDLQRTNPKKFKVYGLNEWGTDADGLVYSQWEVKEFDFMELAAKGYEHRVGMDLGFVDPSTISCSLYNRAGNEIFIYGEWYKRGATLEQITKALQELHLNRSVIYADSADKRAIEFFRSQNFKVVGAKKGAGSVETGIAFLQNHKMIVHPSCKNHITEFENYVYLKDKTTGQYTDKTDHDFSHVMDALRYSYSTIYNGGKLKTLQKKALGL